jgi:chemotaxis family two-component system sensor kinase Cph1
LDDCLSDALWSLQLRIDESGTQIVKHPLPQVVAQPALISRIFQNLIENAIKFRSERPPLIEIKAIKRKDVDVISVSDNGVGIPREFAQRIFEPFQRICTNNNGSRGTGLGLASVRRIVERNGGRVWVESEPGGGSTFFFTLQPSKDLVQTRE